MNRKLSDQQIEQTCQALMTAPGAISGRRLRKVLREKYGFAGRTDRVFTIWRSLTEQARRRTLEPPVSDLLARVELAEARIAEAQKLQAAAEQRAILAEEREVSHQDRWAYEIHDLRQEVLRLKQERIAYTKLQQQYLDLHRENHALRLQLAGVPPAER